MKPCRHWPLAAVVFTAALFCLQSLWIPAKAELAQWLLERSWRQALNGVTDARPWPWADTRVIGVIEAPRLGVRQFVLEGASGRNLAFGPASLTAAQGNDIVLSGHRDTHFRFLGDLAPGDLLRYTTPASTSEFRVAWQEVADARIQELVLESDIRRLTLLTCYPFDAPAAGGPLRYVITALPLESDAIDG